MAGLITFEKKLSMKLDILAIGAHPDDIELCAGGTLIMHVKKGLKCGIVDLTKGELSTRGSTEIRMREAEKASEVLGLSARENLGLSDGFFTLDQQTKLSVVSVIRKYQPSIIIAPAVRDRHPDHGRAAQLVTEAVFLAGLPKIKTVMDGMDQETWRVRAVYHGIQDRYIKPDLVVDVTKVWDKKMEAILSFSSQFYDPSSKEQATPISSKEFLEFLIARAREFGRPAHVELAEGFTVQRTPLINSLTDLS